MILVKIIMTVLPESRKEAVQTLLSLTESIREEKGCKSCQIFHCIEDENILCLVGEWDDREDVEHHMRSNTFGVLLGSKILLKQQDIQIHTVLHTEGDDIVNVLRGKRI